MRFLAYALLAVLTVLPVSLHAEDASVTEKNLLTSERFWPYHVALTQPFQSLPSGTRGVLIRMETTGVARIDFGRDGLFEVPVGSTDLVAAANRVRRGETHKQAPNFVFAIGPRLVDSSAPELRQFLFERAVQQRGFLAVFADPLSEGFPELAKTLAPLAERQGLLTILFPQGGRPDADVYAKLVSLGWRIPFVYSYLTEPYTRSLLPAQMPQPAIQLQTPEGRVLFQSAWKKDALPELSAALDAAFGHMTTAATGDAQAAAHTP